MTQITSPIDHLISFLAKLPGLGPRSAQRAALHLIKKKEKLLIPLIKALDSTAKNIQSCSICGNIDVYDPCAICKSSRRDSSIICVVENIADLWALERAAVFNGLYHVLGGVLSAIDGIGPDDLNIPQLICRAREPQVEEVILATNATVDGQTTAHYISDRLIGCNVTLSGLAHGVPMGGELDYLDDGTLTQALKARKPI